MDQPNAQPLSQVEYDRMVKLSEGIKKLNTELDGLKARASQTLPGGTTVKGDVVIVITESKGVLNQKLFLAQYPVSSYSNLYKQVPDTKKIELAGFDTDTLKELYDKPQRRLTISKAQNNEDLL